MGNKSLTVSGNFAFSKRMTRVLYVNHG